MRLFPRFAFLLLPSALLLFACGGDVARLLKSGTTRERFDAGMKALEKGDYQEAQQFFNTVILQDPGSDFADDAHFYLAETYFRDGDYKLAAFNYNRLRNAFPNSPFQKLAYFRSGESYYFSSPTYDRDQRETGFAIDVFKSFITVYGAEDSLSRIARARMEDLTDKLARKDFMTAELYMRSEDYRSAVMYYERVIEMYPTSSFAKSAMAARDRAKSLLDEDAMPATSQAK